MSRSLAQRLGTVAVCGVLLAGSGFMYYASQSIKVRRTALSATYGAAFFPRLMLLLMAITCVALMLNAWLGKVGASEAGLIHDAEEEAAEKEGLEGEVERVEASLVTRVVRAAGVAVFSVALYFLWKIAGYTVASIVFMAGLAWLLGVRRWWALGALAAFGPFLAALFWVAMKIRL